MVNQLRKLLYASRERISSFFDMKKALSPDRTYHVHLSYYESAVRKRIRVRLKASGVLEASQGAREMHAALPMLRVERIEEFCYPNTPNTGHKTKVKLRK